MASPLMAETPAGVDPTVIVIFGDSFTAGLGLPRKAAFPAQLEARLRADGFALRVVNSGVSGETTEGGLARLDRVLADRPDFVILELGANDALRGIQPAVVRANLNTMIKKIQVSGARLLLAGMRAPTNWGEEYRIAFDRVYPDLARTHRVLLYPFFLQGVASDRELNQPDSLHPNEQGVALLADHIAPIVALMIQGQM
jgi:acyl-CoA thioesterase-1